MSPRAPEQELNIYVESDEIPSQSRDLSLADTFRLGENLNTLSNSTSSPTGSDEDINEMLDSLHNLDEILSEANIESIVQSEVSIFTKRLLEQ